MTERNVFSDKELIEIEVATLYQLDEDDRLVCINDAGRGAAPRFYLGMTREGNIARFRYDLPGDIVEELLKVCSREPVHTRLPEKPLYCAAYREILDAHAPVENLWTGPAYVIPSRESVPPEVIRITPENGDLLRDSYPDVLRRLETCQPVTGMVEDGTVVSVCISSCVSLRAHESGVETLEEHRGKGFATKVVAAWAEAVRELGRIPFYSTEWENVASQRVAEKLGAVAFGVDFHFD
jgi:RimJ/RimL family protein N-acetyltransferase